VLAGRQGSPPVRQPLSTASTNLSLRYLALPFDISLPAVTKHLKVLQRAGLISQGREAQWRPRTLDASPIREVAEWAGEFRRFWDASYARLDNYLDLLKKEEKKNAKRS